MALAGAPPDAHFVTVRMRSVLLATTLVAAACAHNRHAPRGGDAAPEVREVRVEGVSALEEDEIREGLATRATGRWPWSETRRFDRLAASNDERRIETFYGLHGYHGANATHEVTAGDDGAVRVVFRVDEGQPSHIRTIRLPGAERLPDDVRAFALADLPLAPGDVIRAADYDVARVRVQRRLKEKGYADAEVEGQIDVYPDERVADVTLTLEPGPVHRYGEVVFEGLRAIPEDRLRALVRRHLARGELYDPDEVALAEARLRDLGALRTVRVEVEPPAREGGEGTVRVGVAELPVHAVALGGGAGVEQNLQQLQAIVQYRHTNILGNAEQLSWRNEVALRFVPSFVERERQGLNAESTLELTVPELFPRTDLGARAAYNHVFRQAFESDLVGARVAFAYVLGVGSRLTPALGYQRHLALAPRSARGPVPEESSLACPSPCQESTVSLGFARDRRDTLVTPTRGHLLLVDVDYGFPLPNGGLHFARAIPEVRVYVPATPELSIATRARVGAIFPVGGTGVTGLPQRFFGGGDGGHRGFGPEQLGPVVEDAAGGFVTVGGDGLWLVSVEPRMRLTERWGVVAFADYGDVTADPLRIDPSTAHLALGLGARLYTLVGPVRLDVAYRVPRRARRALDTGAPAERDALDYLTFFLSLGEAF